VESFSHVESHFCNFNSNTTLYFVFIFIKIIFSLFYFNFFSLFSFFFSLSSFLFSSLCSPKTHGNPYPRQTHGEPRHGKPTASPVNHGKPTPAQSRQTHAQPSHGNPYNTANPPTANRSPDRRRDQNPNPRTNRNPNPRTNPSPPSTQPPPENQQRRGES
jgi:hypothetical protein